MVEIVKTEYEGHEALRLSNGKISLWVTISVGPRVLGLSAFGGENLFVILPDLKLDYPGEGELSLYGGHRLWYAPEKKETTYIPDSRPVEWREVSGGIEVIQPLDEPTGIRKSMRIVLNEEGARASITHSLKNLGKSAFELAPWAITQMKAGGIGVIPQKTGNQDADGLLPNRNIVLWPYTPISSDFLSIKDEAIIAKAAMTEGALKVGSPNPAGWIGYLLGDQFFVKCVDFQEDQVYLDRGASSQIYCCPEFIELETLGPVVNLQPDQEVRHTEMWEVYPKSAMAEDAKRLLAGEID